MIIRKIIILTVLGGQAIFIGGLPLLLLIYSLAAQQLEEERHKGTRMGRSACAWVDSRRICAAESGKRQDGRVGMHYRSVCVCVCMGKETAGYA